MLLLTFNSCLGSMSVYSLSKTNEKAYYVISRIPTVQPKMALKINKDWRNWIFLLCRVFIQIKNHTCFIYIYRKFHSDIHISIKPSKQLPFLFHYLFLSLSNLESCGVFTTYRRLSSLDSGELTAEQALKKSS